jgi:hypothetical protein
MARKGQGNGGGRGRKGGKGRGEGDLTVVKSLVDLQRIPRLASPAHMSDEMRDVWRITVDALPADWFKPEHIPLLETYCRHVVNARHIQQLIDIAISASPFSVPEYASLLIMHSREGMGISRFATKMRLAQQSTLSSRDEKPGVGKRPWE